MPKPIDTIIIAMMPMPLLRSGFQRNLSWSQPNPAETTTAATTARMTGRSSARFRT